MNKEDFKTIQAFLEDSFSKAEVSSPMTGVIMGCQMALYDPEWAKDLLGAIRLYPFLEADIAAFVELQNATNPLEEKK